MSEEKPREWYVIGCLAEEDTSEPFDVATLVIEKSAYEKLQALADEMAGALGSDNPYKGIKALEKYRAFKEGEK